MQSGKRLNDTGSKRAVVCSLLVLIAMVCSIRGAIALEFVETAWGFDGKATFDTFNPLTVVVRNDSEKRFDGMVTLESTQGFSRQGGILLRPCFLESGASRVLQFYPKISNQSNWRLRAGDDSEDLNSPADGAPATVRIVDGSNPFLRTSGMFKPFPHQRFPTLVGATDGLWAAIIDYAPGFSPSQNDAFFDWLNRGGNLHIFKSADGSFPSLEHPAATLNAIPPADGSSVTQAIGNGSITWHGLKTDELTSAYWKPFDQRKPTLNEDSYAASIDSTIFNQLRQLTRLDIAWPLVYLAAFVYVILLGPGHYFWAKAKQRDYRVVLLALLGSFILFSALFAYIGRRGYGERTTYSTVSLARHIAADRYDVTTWTNLFVTRGDDYEIKHPASHNLYSTGDVYEKINASIRNGREGAMITEIPVFSGRQFIHRGTVNGIAPPKMTSGTGSDNRQGGTWQLPSDISVKKAWIRTQDGLFDCSINEEQGTTTLLSRDQAGYWDSYHNYGWNTEDRGFDQTMIEAGHHLLQHLTGGLENPHGNNVRIRTNLEKSDVHLFLLANVPTSGLPVEQFPLQQGYTLFHFQYNYEKASSASNEQ